MKKVYLVIKGTIPGVYQDCEEYKKAVAGAQGMVCKGFNQLSEALLWWEANDPARVTSDWHSGKPRK